LAATSRSSDHPSALASRRTTTAVAAALVSTTLTVPKRSLSMWWSSTSRLRAASAIGAVSPSRASVPQSNVTARSADDGRSRGSTVRSMPGRKR
jgi:hypothetical protein